jgi:hypothetical protein
MDSGKRKKPRRTKMAEEETKPSQAKQEVVESLQYGDAKPHVCAMPAAVKAISKRWESELAMLKKNAVTSLDAMRIKQLEACKAELDGALKGE